MASLRCQQRSEGDAVLPEDIAVLPEQLLRVQCLFAYLQLRSSMLQLIMVLVKVFLVWTFSFQKESVPS
jgi:hypothetical protein